MKWWESWVWKQWEFQALLFFAASCLVAFLSALWSARDLKKLNTGLTAQNTGLTEKLNLEVLKSLPPIQGEDSNQDEFYSSLDEAGESIDAQENEGENEVETLSAQSDIPDLNADFPEDSIPETEIEAEDEDSAPIDAEVDYDDYRTKAEQWETWSTHWAHDPVSFMQMHMDLLTPQQKDALLSAAPTAEPIAQAWEPESAAEEWLLSQKDTLEALPKRIPELATAVSQEFQFRDQLAHEHYLEVATLKAQVQALTQLMDASLPEVNRGDIEKHLAAGKNYFEAVDLAYKPTAERHVKAVKQARKPRPSTPASSSNDMSVLDGEKDMVRLYRKLSALS